MTNEELMVPRFKQLALYPECERHGYRRVGDIWTDDNKKPVTNQLGEVAMPLRWEVFPELFRRLPWYSDRIIADLPEYVLWSEDSDQEVSKVTEWSDKHSGVYALINGGLVHPGTSSLLPSTKEEYETYLSNKHKQKK